MQLVLLEDITLAINASQLDIITNQLGDSVSVVTEPEHRDTFLWSTSMPSKLSLLSPILMFRVAICL